MCCDVTRASSDTMGINEMTGREILIRALNREETPRPAWVPFVGVHGGHLLGLSAEEYLRSADHIVEGTLKAAQLYRPDGIPIVFDLQLEAEVLGCDLMWGGDVPPSVTSHPLTDANALDSLPALDTTKGRFPIVGEAARRLRTAFDGRVVLYGLVTGPFTLLSHLRGSEVFMDMLLAPGDVKKAMAYCAQITKDTADFYLENGAEVIAVVDPMTSQISPEHFEEFVTPAVNEVFAHVRHRKAFSSLFVCGDATRNLDVMCQTQCDNVSIDENISLDLLRELAEKYNKSFGGNLKLTTCLLLGSEADCMLDAIACIDAGGSKGYICAPGCDLPYGTPEANLRAVSEMVHDEYRREVARTTAKATEADDFDDIQLPDYADTDSVTVDCITLDSAACAPCQYLVDAATKAAAKAHARVNVVEHKIKNREGIGMMCRLHVENIPTICIDGVPKFISVIPDTNTLVAAIEERYNEKRDQ
jgi:MtaA/CmuA family methyltransferase